MLLAIGQTLAWAGLYYVFPALLLRWELEMGWSKSSLTLAITMAVIISAAASPLTGRIIDRGHGPLLMGGSALVGGIGLFALSMVETLWQFQLAWAVIGLAMSGALYEPCFALVTRARGADAKRPIIFITLAAGFASTISFPVIHSLHDAFGWRFALVLTAAMICLLVVPILWLGAHLLERNRDVEADTDTPGDSGEKRFLTRPVFWFLALGFCLIAVVHGATLHHLLAILDDRGLTAEMAVLAASFIGPMQVAGRLAMMASEKLVSHHGLTVGAFLGMGLATLLLYVSGASPAALSGFVILFGGAYGTVSILRPLVARDLLGQRNFGAKSGALALFYLAGSATSPYLGSLVWGIGGYDAMLLSLLAVAAVGCIFYLTSNHLAGQQPGGPKT